MKQEAFPKRFPWKIFSRLALIQALLILFALAGSGLAAHHFFRKQFIAQVELQLKDTLIGFSHSLPEQASIDWCGKQVQGTGLRATWIAADGRVLCDSHHAPGSMENHLERPEVQEALRHGSGNSIRISNTLERGMLYEAIALQGGTVVRGAIPLSSVEDTLKVFDASVGVFLGFLAILLGGFALYSGRELVWPMTRLLQSVSRILKNIGDESPREAGGPSYGEWSELEESIDEIRKDIARKVETLVMERQQHSTLMGAISDAILAIDREGLPLFYNSRFAVLFGGDKLKRAPRLFEIFRQPEILEAFKEVLRGGNPAQVNSIPVQYTGESYFFSLSVAPLLKNQTEVYGAVGVFHDITELKKAEQMRIDFVANVSHELRTPLTAIKGFADTLSNDLKAGKSADPSFLEVITRNAERLMSLIHDLLDLSALESTELVQKTRVDTTEISDRVLAQLRGSFERKRQRIRLGDSAGFVHADPRRLEQVLVNLLDNASKYSPAEGEIELLWERADNSSTLLKVKDSGPGIAPEHHSRLFERFYRVDKGRSRDLGGTGLGLAIVKHILQRHGGSASVQSTPGAGATFICRFPDPTA